MKLWVQRVTEAAVSAGGEVLASIGAGLLVLFAAKAGDGPDKVPRLAKRLAALRIFEDPDGKTNLSVMDTGGSVLAVSQFTLYADTKHGHRPGFSLAARPETALPLYLSFVGELKRIMGDGRVGTGRFGAEMRVSLVNDGPFSVELEE